MNAVKDRRPDQATAAEALWLHTDRLADYATRGLRPVEVLLLVRYREAFEGAVLELGCGGGRVTGYLVDLARRAVGLDISPVMVDHCRRTYPAGEFDTGDLRALDRYADDTFDVVFPTFNVLDVLDHEERGRALDEIHRILAPGGLLVLSTHNRAAQVDVPGLRRSDPLRFAVDLARLPRKLQNRRRLLPAERQEPDYAILNDAAHGFRGLHHYETRDAGARNLREHDFEELECLDLEGHPIEAGAAAAHSGELHFVARRA